MISTRSLELVIDTVVCLTLAKWETVSGQFGGYLKRQATKLRTGSRSMLLTSKIIASFIFGDLVSTNANSERDRAGPGGGKRGAGDHSRRLKTGTSYQCAMLVMPARRGRPNHGSSQRRGY
jgi:hypothetical protein